MAKKSTPKSTPIINPTARLSLAWLNEDGLGDDCFLPNEDGSKNYEKLQVWLPEFSSLQIDEEFKTPGHHEITPVIFANMREFYKAAKTEKNTLRAAGAHVVDRDLGLLRYRVGDERSTFAGRTGIRLTVFAAKA